MAFMVFLQLTSGELRNFYETMRAQRGQFSGNFEGSELR